ncbi:MAG: purine-binding chemotaxis protein CheW [Candidatus Paceibacteria bacterium]|jgi:purine-binding chemotaxis protein CheW
MENATSAEVQQLCTFHVGNLFLGVDVRVVQEVIRYQEMTAVPMAPAGVEGLINLRGKIVTAIDLRRQLGIEPSDPEKLPMNVVIRADDCMASLLVDEIGDVVDIDPSLIEPPPGTLPESARKYVTNVFKMENQLLLLLDPHAAIRVVEPNSRKKREDTPK